MYYLTKYKPQFLKWRKLSRISSNWNKRKSLVYINAAMDTDKFKIAVEKSYNCDHADKICIALQIFMSTRLMRHIGRFL